MGFLPPEPPRRPHYCRPAGSAALHPEGTRWQCDDCGIIWRVESVRDRNVSQLEWVKE